MNFDELGHFLRARREAVSPDDVGLTPGGRRRTPGLRRAEVALLANISVDYYERLEQGRSAHPSQSLLSSLAHALRLSRDECEYLFNLADYPPPQSDAVTGSRVDSGTLFVLDSLTTVPAQVMDGLTNVLAQNELSVTVTGSWAGGPGRHSNMAWRWFTESEARVENFFTNNKEIGRRYAAGIRATWAARGRDRVSSRLVADLKGASREFVAYWDEMGVGTSDSMDETLIHPDLGLLETCRETAITTTSGHHLVVLRPRTPETAERFASARDAKQRSLLIKPIG